LEQKLDVELLIVDSDPERNKLVTKVEKLGTAENVNFYGAVAQNELPALYSSAQIVVVPSVVGQNRDQEGLGLIIIETMGCGCAVIASSLGVIRDVIQDDYSGIFVEPANFVEITSAASELLNNKDARASVLEKFDWEVASNRYVSLLKDLISTT